MLTAKLVRNTYTGLILQSPILSISARSEKASSYRRANVVSAEARAEAETTKVAKAAVKFASILELLSACN